MREDVTEKIEKYSLANVSFWLDKKADKFGYGEI